MKNTLLEYGAIYSVLQDSTGAPGTTSLNSTPIDASGFDGVMFIAQIDTIPTGVTTGIVGLYPMVGDSSGTVVATTGAAFIAQCTSLSTDHDGATLVVDVRNPAERWVGCQFSKDSTNRCRANIIALAYNAQYMPVTQSTAHVIDSAVALTPTV